MLAERLKKARERLNLTQSTVASELGVEIGTLSGYERGYRKPSPEVIAKLSKIYQVSADYLLGITNDQIPYQDNPILSSFEYNADASDMKEIIDLLSGSSPEARENAIKILKALNEPKK